MKASIIIRAYNAASTIERAVKSAFAQDFPSEGFEVIIIDDGSTDNTVQVATTHVGLQGVRVISQTNSGIVEAANRGFREARGEYVTLLDADDEFEPNLLSVLTAALDSDSSLVFAYPDYWEEYRGRKKRIHVGSMFESIAGGILFRKESILKEGGMRGTTIFPEYELFLRTWGRWRGIHVAEPLMTYHRSRSSLTGNAARVQESIELLRMQYPERSMEIALIRSYSL